MIRAALVATLLAAAATAHADKIVGIRVYGNERTAASTVRFIADVDIGAELTPELIKSLAFRGLAFWDTAYTAFMAHDDSQRNYLPEELGTGRERWRNGVGAGFRLYIRSVVLPLVGVDIGYGIEVNDVNVYFAVGLTEL